jgi:hypothetical protein
MTILSNSRPLSTRGMVRSVALILALAVLAWQLTHLRIVELAALSRGDDFLAYWSTSRLQVSGRNPYSPADLLSVQTAAGWTDSTALMLWNPPWTLFFVLPFGVPDYPASRLLWLAFNVGLILFSAAWLWRFYGGAQVQPVWVAWLVALLFAPTLFMLKIGQIGGLMLLGLVLFLLFVRREQWALAGAATVVIAIKPALLYLFWLALLAWAIDRRRWSVLVGGITAAVVATAVPLAFNPAMLSQYIATMTHQAPIDYATPTLGMLLRLMLGIDHAWLQFLPSVGGALWFAWYWHRHRATWRWDQQLGLILLVSIVTTSYGWSFDQVVILPALIQAVVWILYPPTSALNPSADRPRRAGAIAAYLLLFATMIVLNRAELNDIVYVWVAPVLLGAYLWADRIRDARLLSGRIRPTFDTA